MHRGKEPWDLLGVEKHQLPLLLPTAYRDYRNLVTDFNRLPGHIGGAVVVSGWCVKQGWVQGTKPRFSLQLHDDQGNTLSLTLFASAEEVKALPDQEFASFAGEVDADFVGRCYLKRVCWVPPLQVGRIVPTYPAIKGKVTRDGVFTLITNNLTDCMPACLEWLRQSVGHIPVPDMRSAIGCRTWTFDRLIAGAHWPTSIHQGEACLAILERLAAYVEAYRLHHACPAPKPAVRPIPNGGFEGIPERVPFPLTGEQISIARDIMQACASESPSQNLLLGDVGYGKSYVIALVVAAVIRGGGRVAVMLPSRILCNQMHELFCSLFPEFNPQLMQDGAPVGDPSFSLWVGTTGLIHQQWDRAWDLVVVDEQQRFSVAQREALGAAHLLEATATPICRSMALSRWGSSINLFRLTQCPVKRKIESRVFMAAHRLELMERVLMTLEKGKQVMVVCPRKDEGKVRKGGGKSDSDINDEHASVARVVADFERILPRMALRLGYMPRIVHATGARTEEENEAALDAMKAHEAHIIIATTVVETGITIPHLAQVIIYHADRLGAVQLHQLRGRLVRTGGHGLFDLYLPTPPSPTTLKRMAIMTTCTQGYDVAMADLRLRGTGDLIKGTSQSGSGDSVLPRRPIDIDMLEHYVSLLSHS